MVGKTEKIFRTYYQDVYRYLYSLSRDASLSEDLASEVFVEVIKTIGSFRGESDLKTWLFSIARHRWFHHLRQQKRQPETELISDFLESTEKLPEEICLDKSLADRIRQLLAQEPERTRGIVEMRMEGYSFYEIGNAFHISENSARVIDFRAKTKIRNILQKEGFLNE